MTDISETDRKHLSNINSPEDLKKLDMQGLRELAVEIRAELLDVVSSNGGHLAPNLGVVELTEALHYVFNAPEDKIIWDVGHQGYVHKLLTGRREFFRTLRQTDGCLGFLSRDESEYDPFGAGHAGTAISAALGMAVARDSRDGTERIIAVLGDGALSCGISLEALNNVYGTAKDLIIVLNDNKMSISENVGAIPRYLNRIISGRNYNRFKAFAKMMLKRIPGGDEINRRIARIEEATKSIFVPGVFFEELGIRYLGPIPGHDLEELVRTFEAVKTFSRPVIVHVITEKGRGYKLAEESPEKFHGLSSFDPDTGKSNGVKGSVSFSSAFGKCLCDMAEKHSNIAVISAAMRYGTGLSEFSERFPEKFFDVGIAEEHAAVFAAGLAAGGMKPVLAIYSTFLQRALDPVFHDICLQKLPVIICADRSGIVDDGPTHHGIHDLSFLLNMPNLAILSPSTENELRDMLSASFEKDFPVLVRYPRGASGVSFDPDGMLREIEWGKAETAREGTDIVLWAAGRELHTALAASDILRDEYNINAGVVNTRFLKPFDRELLLEHAGRMPLVTIEDCQVAGGLGSVVDGCLVNSGHKGVLHFGWGLDIVPHGDTSEIRRRAGITPGNIARKCAETFIPEKKVL